MGFALPLLLAACAAAQTPAATTPTPVPTPVPTPINFNRTFTLPVVGLSGTETMQVNIANLATVPTSSTATSSCTGTVTFSNSSGAPIGTATKFTTSSGDITSIPLPFSKTGFSNRGEILVTLQQTVTPSVLCTMGLSLEVFDTNSGVLHAVISTSTEVAVPTPLTISVLN